MVYSLEWKYQQHIVLMIPDDVSDTLLSILSFSSCTILFGEISLLFLLHREGTELSKIKQFAWNHTAKSVKAGIRALICMVSKSLLHPLCCLKKWLKTIFSYIIKHTFLWSLVIHIRNKYFYMAHSFFPHSFAREQNVRHNLMS